LLASSGSLVNSFRYTGREFDPETSLYYYRARYYDPVAGRFLREDPFGFQAGPNFYAYTLNQPSNFADPLGLDIAVVENGPTPPSPGEPLGNPIGHTALCISGAGVFSFEIERRLAQVVRSI
jgi:RHS repeat-associated protein